jgi:hypothetical protein
MSCPYAESHVPHVCLCASLELPSWLHPRCIRHPCSGESGAVFFDASCTRVPASRHVSAHLSHPLDYDVYCSMPVCGFLQSRTSPHRGPCDSPARFRKAATFDHRGLCGRCVAPQRTLLKPLHVLSWIFCPCDIDVIPPLARPCPSPAFPCNWLQMAPACTSLPSRSPQWLLLDPWT